MKRFGLLIAGVLAATVMLVCSATSLVWNLQGRPSESYPELVFAFVGLPMALLATVCGVLFALLPGVRWIVGSVGGLAIGACAVLLVGAVLPVDGPFVTVALEILFRSVPVGFVLVAVSTAVALARRLRRATR